MNTDDSIELSDETGTVQIFKTADDGPGFVLLNANFNNFADLINQHRCAKVFAHIITPVEPIDLNILNENSTVTHLSLTLSDENCLIRYSNETHRFFKQLKIFEFKGEYPANFPSFKLFSNPDKLEIEYSDLHSDWKANDKLIDLVIYHYSEPSLDSLNNMNSLRRLRLVNSHLRTLDGIDQIKSLETLHIVGARRLKDVNALSSAKNLKNINFESFSTIKDWEILTNMPQLEYLSLYDMKTVDFISQLPNLVYFMATKLNGKSFPQHLLDSIQSELRQRQISLPNQTSLPFFEKLER